jgi:surfeit locus 1 family protein
VPIVRIPIGRRVFAPSWLMTALTAALCVAFVALGRWQWDRGVRRQAQWDAFARGADAPLVLGGRDIGSLPRFRRVEVTGRYDGTRQFLLDNRTHAGSAGYEVLAPLALDDGRVLLVDRGWVPFTGSRARLPDVRLRADAPLTVTGRLDDLPVPGLELGRMPPDAGEHWPKVTSYPSMRQLSDAYGRGLESRIVLLDPTAPFGYVRDWQPPGLPPIRHFSYAVQWWGFAATILVIWLVLSAPRVPPRGQQPDSRPSSS